MGHAAPKAVRGDPRVPGGKTIPLRERLTSEVRRCRVPTPRPEGVGLLAEVPGALFELLLQAGVEYDPDPVGIGS